MKARMNQAGPHNRDIDRLIRAVEAMGLDASYTRASTGSVYITIAGECGERVYRLASHAECYDRHDFSVCSGSTQPGPAEMLPPGYDGWVSEAILDAAEWCGAMDSAPARRAAASIARWRDIRAARLLLAEQRREAAKVEVVRSASPRICRRWRSIFYEVRAALNGSSGAAESLRQQGITLA